MPCNNQDLTNVRLSTCRRVLSHRLNQVKTITTYFRKEWVSKGLYTLLDRLVYLIVEHWSALTLIGILAYVIPSVYIIGFTNKAVIKTQKYLIALVLLPLAVAMISLKIN